MRRNERLDAAARSTTEPWPLADPRQHPDEPRHWRHACRVLALTASLLFVAVPPVAWVRWLDWTDRDRPAFAGIIAVAIVAVAVVFAVATLRTRRTLLTAGPWGPWRRAVPYGTHRRLGFALMFIISGLLPLSRLRPEWSKALDIGWWAVVAIVLVGFVAEPGWGRTAPGGDEAD